MDATETNDVVALHPAVAVTGRVLFTLIFFLSGVTHFTSLNDYVARSSACDARSPDLRAGQRPSVPLSILSEPRGVARR